MPHAPLPTTSCCPAHQVKRHLCLPGHTPQRADIARAPPLFQQQPVLRSAAAAAVRAVGCAHDDALAAAGCSGVARAASDMPGMPPQLLAAAVIAQACSSRQAAPRAPAARPARGTCAHSPYGRSDRQQQGHGQVPDQQAQPSADVLGCHTAGPVVWQLQASVVVPILRRRRLRHRAGRLAGTSERFPRACVHRSTCAAA
jgi:hypothetical protein